MLVVTLITLYTSRIVLKALGADDFGIYNVAGGVIAFLSVLSTSMSNSTQRFLNEKKGENDIDGLSYIMSLSIKLHKYLALGILLIGETLGLFVVMKILTFPQERYIAAILVYQASLLSLFFTLIRIPYVSLAITYENFTFIAWTSLIDVFVKLAFAFGLFIISSDKLVFYGFSYALMSFLQCVLFVYYCRKKFVKQRVRVRDLIDRVEGKKLISFTSWSMMGNIGNTCANQGIGLIFNAFYALSVNAALGITNQVTNTIASFINNVQLAFRPQLLQSYSDNDKTRFFKLISSASKWSFFMMMLVSVPLLSNINYILELWLGQVPNFTAQFISILVLFLVIDSISTPLYYGIEAVGKIKAYQIRTTEYMCLNVLIAFILCYIGLSPIWSIFSKVLINFLILVYRIRYIKKLVDSFSFKSYFHTCLIPVIRIGLVCAFCFLLFSQGEGLWDLIKSSLTFLLVYCLSLYVLGLEDGERKVVQTKLTSWVRWR